MSRRRLVAMLVVGGAACGFATTGLAGEPASGEMLRPAFREFIEANCLECHDAATRTAGLALDETLAQDVGLNQAAWELVVRKLAARQMPPVNTARPNEAEYAAAVGALAGALDDFAEAHPHPGRGETFRRLNRAEYANAIRDLLALEVDAAALLPADESSQGFDNITVADLSPSLLNRYVAAAQTISRMAVGRVGAGPREETFRMRPDVTQDVHIAGLPLGTRGGMTIAHTFPQDGVYEVQVRLMRDRNEEVESLREPAELEVLLDRARVELFTVRPPRDGARHETVDAHLKARLTTTAGPHEVGVTFVADGASLEETTRQPLNVHFNFYRHPRLGPALYQVSIVGPLEARGAGETPSRRRLVGEDRAGEVASASREESPDEEVDEERAARILSRVMRRAYRRPIDAADLKAPLAMYRETRGEGDFEAGIEAALSAILVNPNFLFRIERDPVGTPSATAYAIGDVELASRLSFFLWSSIPDDELLDAAERGELRQPEELKRQTRRMLADERSRSLVNNFAEQWLYLRNLESFIPDMRLYPDFDDNLRQAMWQETELFFASIVREDRSVLELIRADYSYLNERLARHYGIPHVYGSRFRRVALDAESERGGLLRQASVLAVTSYATRTSPVLRGHWVLKNLVGEPPPPPPPDVPTLDDNVVLTAVSMRQRLQQHRADEACASCHRAMDPVGFALENYDAVGRWREAEAGETVDSSGGFIDGSEFVGPAGLEEALLARPELFVRTLTEKLMTFALGRVVDHHDAPAIRKIVADARERDHRFSELVVGLVRSTPFRMRMSP